MAMPLPMVVTPLTAMETPATTNRATKTGAILGRVRKDAKFVHSTLGEEGAGSSSCSSRSVHFRRTRQGRMS
jgi:hypothetical protein